MFGLEENTEQNTSISCTRREYCHVCRPTCRTKSQHKNRQ